MLTNLVLLMHIYENYNKHKIYFETCDKWEEAFCDIIQNL